MASGHVVTIAVITLAGAAVAAIGYPRDELRVDVSSYRLRVYGGVLTGCSFAETVVDSFATIRTPRDHDMKPSSSAGSIGFARCLSKPLWDPVDATFCVEFYSAGTSHASVERSMSSGATQGCPHCAGTNIIRTGTHGTCDSWYCYGCRRSFELTNGTSVRIERRTGGDRRKSSLTFKD